MTQRLAAVVTLACFACARPHDAAQLASVCEDCGLPLRVDVALPPGRLDGPERLDGPGADGPGRPDGLIRPGGSGRPAGLVSPGGSERPGGSECPAGLVGPGGLVRPDGPGRPRPDGLIRRDVHSLWRYAEVLPVAADAAVTLGEGWTPLIDVGDDVWVKDESQNPTGSFKARGMSVAVSAAVERGVERLVVPSAGNAAGALAAYGARAGVSVTVAMPADTPTPFIEECRHYGAQVDLVDGTIADAGAYLAERRHAGDFDVSTMKEPYRVEGKKTIGYELLEQFDGDLPEVVIYPTGGGTGLVGMWKAWDEQQAMGWIGARRPRLVAVQPQGCAPIVAAHRQGATATEPWRDPRTTAYGLRVPAPIGGFLCLRAIAETHGTAVAVSEPDIHFAAHALASASGIDVCPEAGAAWAAYRRLVHDGWIAPGERTVVFNTGTGLKYR